MADIESFEGLICAGQGPEEICKLLRKESIEPRAGSLERTEYARRNSWGERAKAYLEFVQSIA